MKLSKFLYQEWTDGRKERTIQKVICWKASTIEEVLKLVQKKGKYEGGDITMISKDKGRVSRKLQKSYMHEIMPFPFMEETPTRFRHVEITKIKRRGRLISRMLKQKSCLVIL